MVPRRGLEPPRLSALIPETSASTNSATWAQVAAGATPAEGASIYAGTRFMSICSDPMTRKPRWQQEDPRFGEESARYAKPIPSRELLLAKLREAQKPLAFRRARRAARHPRPGRARGARQAPARHGARRPAARQPRERVLPRRPPAGHRRHVSGHRDGFGFLVPDDGGDDLFLPYREMRMLMHGDRAAVRVTGRDERGRPEGAIVEVLERRTTAGRRALLARGRRRLRRARQPAHQPAHRRAARGVPGRRATATSRSSRSPSSRAAAATRSGACCACCPDGGGADTAIDLAIASHGLSHAFPQEALDEARDYGREVPANAHAGREDLRALPLVTIDGEDARDFDDAVYASATGGGYRLIVAIADVSHYVRPGTALDREARERATSVYFPSRVLPMLPEELSNDLCSLMPRGRPAVHGLRHAGRARAARSARAASTRPSCARRRASPTRASPRTLDGREPRGAAPQARLAPSARLPARGVPGAAPRAREARRARLRGARGQGAGRRRGPVRRTSARTRATTRIG